ncbi:MAG: hypothetical protein QW196_05150 [Sulfolobales archaeon]
MKVARYFKTWVVVLVSLSPALATLRIAAASSALHDALTDALDRDLRSLSATSLAPCCLVVLNQVVSERAKLPPLNQ